MGFIKDLLKIEERKMWKEVMSQLAPSQLDGMTKRDFLRPSTPEMKDRVELAKRCCKYVTSLPMYLEQNRYKNIAARWSDAWPLLEEWNGFPLEFRKEKNISEEDWLILEPLGHLLLAREASNWTPSIDNATLNNANKKYRDKVQKTLDDAAKGIEAQDRHISGMESLNNHSVHSSSVVRALNVMKEIDGEEETERQIQERAKQIRQERQNYGFNFDSSQQNPYNQQDYDAKHTNGHGR